MPDYAILAPPRISRAGFAAILAANASPAASVAGKAYDDARRRGVDPAVLLAVFAKESTYGRYGRARSTHSWGNLRTSPSYPSVDGFAVYPDWYAGATDTSRLLAIYGRNAIRRGTDTSTVQRFPYVWAPASDGNAPDRYGDQLAAWIGAWSRQYPAEPEQLAEWGADVRDDVRAAFDPGDVAAAIRRLGLDPLRYVNEVDVRAGLAALGLDPLRVVNVIDVRALLDGAARRRR